MLLGDLPPGEKWRNFELKALGLRDFARVRIDQPLNPFDLARFANLIVINFDQIEGLSETAREHLLGSASESWSGGACTLPNGMKLVILNPLHGRSREPKEGDLYHYSVAARARHVNPPDPCTRETEVLEARAWGGAS